ncbi:MAG: hypothetical protein Q9188_003095 [Gyalolechia gomerana]
MSSSNQATTQGKMYFSEHDLQIINKSEHEQREFKELVVNSKAYSKAEKAAISFHTFEEFDAFWTRANDDKEDFDKSHQRGCGLFSKRYQHAAAQAQSFAKDLSPIIDLVKNFAAPYGGIAVGTVSVLFVVASKKDGFEERLMSVISEIRDRLPGMKLFSHIYNEKHELDMKLQARIASAYQGFIEFCIEASKYYKGGGPRRWFKALGRPNSILDKASRVQAVIGEIRKLCDELLDKNVDHIKQQNESIKQQNESTKHQNESIKQQNEGIKQQNESIKQQNESIKQQNGGKKEQKEVIKNLEDQISRLVTAQDERTLSEIRPLLGLSAFSDENHRDEFTRYSEALDSDEQLNAVVFEHMRGPRLDSFKACKDYQTWSKSEQSCLLILSGVNNESIRSSDLCWLSPVAITMIKELKDSLTKPIYVYYVFPTDGELLYRAFSVMIWQLLHQKREVLRNTPQCDELRTELDALQRYEGCRKS